MGGNLVMGSNSITGVLLVNGITVESHSSRHLPNGSDPLATGVPSTIGTSNSEGIANVFARQDHIHSHGDQLGGTLHATASTTVAGFMSAVDKVTFDAIPSTYLTIANGVYNVVNVTSSTYNAAQTSGFPVLLVNTTTAASNVTVNLPTAVDNTAEFIIKKIDSSTYSVIVDASSTQTIDGSLTATLKIGYSSISLVSNNSNWFII
jgi:hypothetical protein